MLVGIADPSHTGLKNRRGGKLPMWYSLEDLAAEATEASPKWSPWPWELMAAALGEHQERGDRISTTLLTSACPRGAVLERKVDYVGDLSNMYASLRGTLLHKVLEGYARPGSIEEARFYTEVDGVEFSGSPDLLTPTTVWDWKMTENPPSFGYPYRKHTEQVLVNAYVVRHYTDIEYDKPMPFDPHETPPTKAVVMYIGPKEPKPIQVERKETWVTPAGVEREGKRAYVWSDAEALEYIRPRLSLMRRALKAYPKWVPGAEEVWGGKPGYTCPGPPLCHLPNCLAKRDPDLFVWDQP